MTKPFDDTLEFIHEVTSEGDHYWKSSREELGLVGTLYGEIYPWTCRCGALKSVSGQVFKRKESNEPD